MPKTKSALRGYQRQEINQLVSKQIGHDSDQIRSSTQMSTLSLAIEVRQRAESLLTKFHDTRRATFAEDELSESKAIERPASTIRNELEATEQILIELQQVQERVHAELFGK